MMTIRVKAFSIQCKFRVFVNLCISWHRKARSNKKMTMQNFMLPQPFQFTSAVRTTHDCNCFISFGPVYLWHFNSVNIDIVSPSNFKFAHLFSVFRSVGVYVTSKLLSSIRIFFKYILIEIFPIHSLSRLYCFIFLALLRISFLIGGFVVQNKICKSLQLGCECTHCFTLIVLHQ